MRGGQSWQRHIQKLRRKCSSHWDQPLCQIPKERFFLLSAGDDHFRDAELWSRSSSERVSLPKIAFYEPMSMPQDVNQLLAFLSPSTASSLPTKLQSCLSTSHKDSYDLCQVSSESARKILSMTRRLLVQCLRLLPLMNDWLILFYGKLETIEHSFAPEYPNQIHSQVRVRRKCADESNCSCSPCPVALFCGISWMALQVAHMNGSVLFPRSWLWVGLLRNLFDLKGLSIVAAERSCWQATVQKLWPYGHVWPVVRLSWPLFHLTDPTPFSVFVSRDYEDVSSNLNEMTKDCS